MPSKIQPLTKLDHAERRAMVSAIKPLTQLMLSRAVPQFDVATQNFFNWLSGKDRALSEARQIAMLAMTGLSPYGQLLPDATHTWVVDIDLKDNVDVVLSRETNLRDVRLAPAYTSLTDGRVFIGVAVTWKGDVTGNDEVKEWPRRLLMTAKVGKWVDPEFLAWATTLFSSRARSAKEFKVAPKLLVSLEAATTVWRSGRNDPNRDMPKAGAFTRLFDFKQDIVGAHGEVPATEDAISVLSDLRRRFVVVAESLATQKGSRVGPKDLQLMARADTVLRQKAEHRKAT